VDARTHKKLLFKTRTMLVFFAVSLAISGITAFPVETELHWLVSHPNLIPDFMEGFIKDAYVSISYTNRNYPSLAYGYDWLAFAHVVFAMLFIGPWRSPVKNIWVIEWAMLACIAIMPVAMIAGPIRQIPFYWRLIDCSFGVIGIIPLWICRKWIKQLEMMEQSKSNMH
jgi:hypothetical protein